jgi:hypothetical protein
VFQRARCASAVHASSSPTHIALSIKHGGGGGQPEMITMVFFASLACLGALNGHKLNNLANPGWRGSGEDEGTRIPKRPIVASKKPSFTVLKTSLLAYEQAYHSYKFENIF